MLLRDSRAARLLAAAVFVVLCAAQIPAQTVPATRTIVDQAGQRVTLPARIERIAIIAPWPLPSVVCLVDGSGRRIVGMHPGSHSSARTSILAKTAPDALRASTGFVQGTTINIEELVKLRPDVVFYNAALTAQREAIERAGLRAVGFSTTIAGFNTVETVASWMDLLGVILDRRSRAEELRRYGYEMLGSIYSRVWNIENARKPRALILFRHSDKEIQASGSNFFGDFWLRSTGAVNVAAELSGNRPVNMEQIYAWNPDIIFITCFSATQPEDLFANTVSGQDWSRVAAVRNRRVYKTPNGHYRWFPPSSDTPLMLLWMATKNHPELFRDINFEEEMRAYFRRFHSFNLSDEDIRTILNPPRETADGV